MHEELIEAIRRARTPEVDDKALGRELYHQLQSLGYDGEAIDRAVADPSVALVRAVAAPETAEAPAPAEAAVKPAPKRRTKSDE